MSKAFWEHYSHPADIGIRGFGPTKEKAFAQAALAMTAVITDLRTVQPKEVIEIVCSEQPFDSTQGGEPVEPDDELLFAGWLNALLYEMATRKMLFSKFIINIENHRLQAKAWGEKINLKKHNPVVEVKAATYADLKVQQEKDGNWLAQCIVDV